MPHMALLRGLLVVTYVLGCLGTCCFADGFEGRYFAGEGDNEFLKLLDIARRMFDPDPEFQNASMLYTPAWNGFVEGPTWGAWWIQNSYGPTYCAMPFYVEPYTTFLRNSHDLWFSQMGDGKRKGANDWVAPDGCLCDAAAPGWIVYRQGDGRTDIHDWGMEFTAAGLLMQSEMLLISRDKADIDHYLPMLERCAAFIETRRDPQNDCFLAGPAGNLLAPSYAGWKKPDGTYDKAYLTGLSVTYIAALDRLIEVEKAAGRAGQAADYTAKRDSAKRGLEFFTVPEGYFVRYVDPDGTRHGVFGAAKYGYFEASPNHDAVAFRVTDDAQSGRIFDKIASIPELRPHVFILPNYPGYDDMYEEPTSWLWKYGTWVNGGHWSTCEGRMMLAYFRLGKYEDARRSMQQLLTFARDFRMDNPLVEFGSKVYQPKEPINLCYDSFGPPAGLIRGLFEYLYKADEVILRPHIPSSITRLEQRFPIRFGAKRLFLGTTGNGEVSSVFVNGRPWKAFDHASVRLAYSELPDLALVEIGLGGSEPARKGSAEDAAKADMAFGVRAVPESSSAFWSPGGWALVDGNTLPLRVGADSEGLSRFLGDIRRVRIFKRALSEKEVEASGSGTGLDRDAALVADYNFGQLADGRIRNQAADGLDAKLVGRAEVVDVPGGKALRFAGEGFVEVAHDPRIMLRDAYTLEAWVSPSDLPATGVRIIDKVKAGVDNGYLLDTCPGGSLRLITEQGTLGYDAKLEVGKWRHVAATFDAKGDLCLYLDGRRVAFVAAKKRGGAVSYAGIGRFYDRLLAEKMDGTYEAQHARVVIDALGAIQDRQRLEKEGKLPTLPEASQAAADRSYAETLNRLSEGLGKAMESYSTCPDERAKQVLDIWRETTGMQ